MSTANALRIQIEHALERRFPAALSPMPRTIRETAATGIPEIDELLDGGLPVGAISEITGPECSGRTSLVLSFLAQRTREGHVCAWVDAEDAFDPQSAAASGVELKQLLWVRCRNEDRNQREKKPWRRLDQVVRATDLLLQAGGFSAIVLDLAGTAPDHARRIPLATWFRFRQAAQRSQCSLVVLGQDACAQSSAESVLECAPWRSNACGETVLMGFTYEVRSKRGPAAPSTLSMAGQRKPPVSTWSATGAWDVENRDLRREIVVDGVRKFA
jgi:recombination protein RecA